MGEATRFTFRLGSDIEQLLIEDPDALVGTEVPVRWGDQKATGRIERLDSGEAGLRVTMVIDAPPEFIEVSWAGGGMSAER